MKHDQAELAEADRYLDGVSQRAQHEAATIEKMDRALTIEKAAVEDLQIVSNVICFCCCLVLYSSSSASFIV